MDTITDILLQIEEEHDLLSRKINDFYYWGYIRFSIDSLSRDFKQNNNVMEFMRLKDYLGIFLNCTIYNPLLLKKNRKSIIIINHQRRVKNGSYYECIYTDKLAEILEKDVYIMEFLNKGTHLKPTQTKNLLYMDFVNVFAVIQKHLNKGGNKKIMDQITKEVDFLYKILSSKLDININQSELQNLIAREYYRYHYRKKWLNMILKKLQPKLIIEVVSYEINRMIVNEIAYSKNIPVIELQHGIIGKEHISYNFSMKQKLPFFPTDIFVFSDFWKNTARWPIENESVHVTGFPYIENQIEKYGCTSKNKNTLNILIISQPLYGKVLSELAISLYKELSRYNTEFKIIYKLHPEEYMNWEIAYKELSVNREKIEVVCRNEHSIYHYFNICNIQVGAISTALFEGIAFNLKTYILKTRESEIYMQDLVKSNLALLISNANQMIEDLLQLKNKADIDVDINYFWEKDALTNVLLEIDNILKKYS
ncbi:hypothetical protein DES36_12518 [Alkalibaculum bacchi]|uniref:Capsular polysaccharide biosynthesis protein n=1 Tax=Alkalibaculum bacchi TaxID=645887 RepID=A0A366HY60_9FIRM|nr:hypothetical protein [Alkalibaculum bacchi]RBP58083.1 hypothetical protein DES36_12518 [Alkalibaculum bacchi]